jgi:hypothetical protein
MIFLAQFLCRYIENSSLLLSCRKLVSFLADQHLVGIEELLLQALDLDLLASVGVLIIVKRNCFLFLGFIEFHLLIFHRQTFCTFLVTFKADILHILGHNRVGYIATMFKGFIAQILRHVQ